MEVDDLDEEQSNALSRFREFTHIDSVETCRQFLAAHEWDVERAIETALISNSDNGTNDIEENLTPENPSPIPSAPPMPDSFFHRSEPTTTNQNTFTTPRRSVPNTSATARYMPNAVLRLFRAPLSFFYAIYLKLQPILPWTIIRFVCSFVRSLFWHAPPPDPLQEIDAYCTDFNNQYGTQHPAFYRGRFVQALQDAQREVRLLFVYLHEKNSPLCDRFSREVLCGDALQSTIGNHLLWSASRDTQEGAHVSQLLHANRFPCFCIVAHHGSQQTVQLKLDRYTDPDECLAEILNAVQHADQTLQHNRERRNVSNSRDRLLEEQNAAYLDSVRADQEKARQRSIEENERRKIEEEQRRQNEEQQKKLQKFAEFRDHLRQTLSTEPSATELDTIQVSIRLPVNEPIRRRFRRSDPARVLFEFAWTNNNVPDKFELLWGYPRKRYQYEHIGEQTIRDVMSGNSETCYLEQIEDESAS